MRSHPRKQIKGYPARLGDAQTARFECHVETQHAIFAAIDTKRLNAMRKFFGGGNALV